MNRKEREKMRKKMENAKRDRILAMVRIVYDRKHDSSSGST